MANGALRTELTTDPLRRGYAAMTDEQAAASLLAVDIPVRQRVSIARLQATAMEQSVYLALRTAIATPTTPPQLMALCQTVLDLVQARFEDVDLDNPRSKTIWAALQQYGVITAAQSAAIDALADGVVSRASQLGLGDVTAGEVGRAR